MPYKALGRSIANHDAPVWSTNASESNIGKIQRAQNVTLRIITGERAANTPTLTTARITGQTESTTPDTPTAQTDSPPTHT